jgi:hypothetical protein
MRTFVGALLLGVGASAVAVLMAVAGNTQGDSQVAFEPASQACEEASDDCVATTLALTGRAMLAPSDSGDAAAARVRLPGDIFVDHPYPDHP